MTNQTQTTKAADAAQSVPLTETFDYSADEIRTAKAERDTYVGSVSMKLSDGRRVVAFTRNTIAHGREMAVKALTMPGYRNRLVSIILPR